MSFQKIADDVRLGTGVYLAEFINLYGCTIGDGSRIGAFVEIQKNATIGKNSKISSHTFVCEGVDIGDGVFIGHGVTFINDKRPRATNTDGSPQSGIDWQVIKTVIKNGASIGSGSTIMCGVTVGENATVGAGSVVLHDVAPGTTVAGNPTKILQRNNHAL